MINRNRIQAQQQMMFGVTDAAQFDVLCLPIIVAKFLQEVKSFFQIVLLNMVNIKSVSMLFFLTLIIPMQNTKVGEVHKNANLIENEMKTTKVFKQAKHFTERMTFTTEETDVSTSSRPIVRICPLEPIPPCLARKLMHGCWSENDCPTNKSCCLINCTYICFSDKEISYDFSQENIRVANVAGVRIETETNFMKNIIQDTIFIPNASSGVKVKEENKTQNVTELLTLEEIVTELQRLRHMELVITILCAAILVVISIVVHSALRRFKMCKAGKKYNAVRNPAYEEATFV